MDKPTDKKLTLLKKCTARRTIKVGEIIPNEISFYFTGGSGYINLSGVGMDHLFKKELSKLQDSEYQFNEICRNRKEQKAWYSAITFNLNKLGYQVEYLPS